VAARRSLRTRLIAAFIALAVGVIAVAGTTTYLLVRRTAKQNAISDLEKKFDDIDSGTAAIRRLVRSDVQAQTGRPRVAVVAAFAAVLRLSGAQAVFLQNGQLVNGTDTALRALFVNGQTANAFVLPAPLANHTALLQPEALANGDIVSGSVGNTVFAARQIQLFSNRIPALGQPVVILTTEVNTHVGRAGPIFLIVAGVTLIMAAGVAFWLGRRMTRPVREIQSTAVKIAGGDLTARAVVADNTDDEFASLAGTLNTMAEQLEQARGSERAFLLSVSHDLRTPLTSIRGYAEALGDGTLDDGDPEARKRAASVITAEARRLERLVRDLLDLARLDSHQFSLRPRPCDACEVVADAAQAFAPAASDMGIELQVQRNGTVDADLDPERLAQIVANLVENALKYAETRVDVSVAQAGGNVAIGVTDDGPGVPPDELPHVFERLYTGRGSAGRAVGTGLGLAIVSELAVAMGGEASAHDDPTGGTQFVVEIPASR
jgi:signal transduction histidine kinase